MTPVRKSTPSTRHLWISAISLLFSAVLLTACSNGSGATTSTPKSNALYITTNSLTKGVQGTAYSQTLTATGGSGAGYTWSVLPGTNTLSSVGLALSSAGVLSGASPVQGTASFTAVVTDSVGDTANLSLTVTIAGPPLTVSSSSLSSATYKVAYTATLAATGGTGTNYAWSATTSGTSALSAVGLSLSSAGVLSGTPTNIGTVSFGVQVTDSGSNVATATLAIAILNPQSTPTGTVSTATVTVSSTAVGTLGTNFLGFSYGKSLVNSTPYALSSTDTGLINLFKLLIPANGASNPPVLRIGGSQVDSMVWSATGTGGVSSYVEAPDVAALAGFVAATGWQTLYGINLASTAPGSSPAQTTTLAQQEVSSVTSQFAGVGALPPWYEIGNECDNYGHSGHPYNGLTWDLPTFETLWSTYRSAILSAVPAAVVTGPASGNNETTWTEPFALWATSSKISVLTQHYYRFSGGTNPTPQNLISYPDNIANDGTTGNPASNSLTVNTSNTGTGVTGGYIGSPGSCTNSTGLTCTATAIGVPWRMTETNSLNSAGSSGPLGTSNGYGSALWILDHMFTLAYGGAVGVNISGINSDATGYQPISFSTTNTVQSVNPAYYGMLLFAQAGSGTLLNTTVNAGTYNLSAYAVKTTAGGTNLVIVNKEAATNFRVTFALPQSVSSTKLLQLTQLTTGSSTPDLTAATGVTLQGATVSTVGSFTPGVANTCTISGGTQVTCYAPLLSAVVVQMQ